jgi:hypothetical protein
MQASCAVCHALTRPIGNGYRVPMGRGWKCEQDSETEFPERIRRSGKRHLASLWRSHHQRPEERHRGRHQAQRNSVDDDMHLYTPEPLARQAPREAHKHPYPAHDFTPLPHTNGSIGGPWRL